MKKHVIAAAITLAATSWATAATGVGEEASVYPSFDGTINFSGAIIQTACTVNQGSKALTIDMGKIPVSSFSSSTPMVTSLRKNFALVLDCPEGLTSNKATVRFDGSPAAGKTDVIALSSGSGAKNIGVQLTDEKGEVIHLNADSSVYNLVEGSNNLSFSAYYYPTSAATPTPGTANATVNFSIIYQ